MKKAVGEFLIRVRSGMTPDRALDLLQQQIRHENFYDLITAIRFSFRHRGNLTALMEQVEIQLHRIEEEHDRRRLSNARDVTLTLLILLAVPLLFSIRLMTGGPVSEIFLGTLIGQAALSLSAAIYGLAIAAFVLVRRQIAG